MQPLDLAKPVVYIEYAAHDVHSTEVCGICQDLLFNPVEYRGRVYVHCRLNGEGLQDPVHEYCIKKWFLKRDTCPYCRHKIDLSDKLSLREKTVSLIGQYLERHADSLENYPITLKITNLAASVGLVGTFIATCNDYASLDSIRLVSRSLILGVLILNKLDYYLTINILRERRSV